MRRSRLQPQDSGDQVIANTRVLLVGSDDVGAMTSAAPSRPAVALRQGRRRAQLPRAWRPKRHAKAN